MTKVHFTPKIVNTRNVSGFGAMMDGLMLARSGHQDGDERLACVWGRAGLGKTRTAQIWAANNAAVYLETVRLWSEMDFLHALCRELGIVKPTCRRGRAFAEAMEVLLNQPRIVMVDEIERCGQRMLEVVRDLAKLTGGVFVLIGEPELVHLMKQNRRIWSRTYREMEFTPSSPADVVTFVNQTTGLKLSPGAMTVLHDSSGGDLRLIRRDTISLVHVINSMGREGEVSRETAEIAVKQSLKGA
jgi:type II secretory pathway predicted ATPase ExeA